MKHVQFANFIGFGKRMSIDIRCVISDATASGLPVGMPVHLTVSDETPNTGDRDGIHASFNEMAGRLLVDLVMRLHNSGLSALHVELAKRLSSAQEEREGNSVDVQATFADLIALIYELNNETFLVEG